MYHSSPSCHLRSMQPSTAATAVAPCSMREARSLASPSPGMLARQTTLATSSRVQSSTTSCLYLCLVLLAVTLPLHCRYDFNHTKQAAVTDLGFSWMLSENEALQRKYELKPPLRLVACSMVSYVMHCCYSSGVVVTALSPLGPAKKAGIQPDDVILEIAGHKIANDGTVCALLL